jgi:pSer/pThr/pTyr-binding forkhead associated (FHA) protein
MSAFVLLGLRVLLALTLYAFLGWLLWMQVRALQATLAQSHPSLHLRILHPDGRQETRLFTAAPVLVGRAPDNHIVLEHPTVSGHHLQFSYHHNRWWVEDLESHNGTFLNGIRLNTSAVLVSDDTIRLGACEIHVRNHPAPEEKQTEESL